MIHRLIAFIIALLAAASAMATDDMSRAIFGVPMATVLAAFAGAMIALTFIPAQGPIKAIASVLSGTVGGAYLAPFFMKTSITVFPSMPILHEMDKPVAFLLGLGFQVIVPLFYGWIKKRGEVR